MITAEQLVAGRLVVLRRHCHRGHRPCPGSMRCSTAWLLDQLDAEAKRRAELVKALERISTTPIRAIPYNPIFEIARCPYCFQATVNDALHHKAECPIAIALAGLVAARAATE